MLAAGRQGWLAVLIIGGAEEFRKQKDRITAAYYQEKAHSHFWPPVAFLAPRVDHHAFSL